MKKRMIALMLAGIMVLSVTACGGGGASSKNQNNQDDGESKQVGVEVTEDMQSAPPEDAPVGGQVVVAISPGCLLYTSKPQVTNYITPGSLFESDVQLLLKADQSGGSW